MSMETELRTLVKTATGLANVNWGGMAVPVYPCIDVHHISEKGQHHMQGRSEVRSCLVQCDIWARDFAQAMTIKNAVLTLDTHRAEDDATVRSIMLSMIRSGEETTQSDDVLHRVSIDFNVFYTI